MSKTLKEAQANARRLEKTVKAAPSIARELDQTVYAAELVIKDKSALKRVKKLAGKLAHTVISMLEKMDDRAVKDGAKVRIQMTVDRNGSSINNIRHLSSVIKRKGVVKAHEGVKMLKARFEKISTRCLSCA
jgi:hypothetical protein